MTRRLTRDEQIDMLARLGSQAEELRITRNAHRDDLILILPMDVLPQSIAIHGYRIEHSPIGPGVFWRNV